MKTKSLIFLFLASLAFNYGCKSKAKLAGIDNMPKERIKQIKEFLDNHEAYSYIPAATKYIRSVEGDTTDIVTVNEFFISKTEISNAEYMEFVQDVNRKHGKDSSDALLPDTTIWPGGFSSRMKKYYLRHPAYKDYPVVGVTHRQAERYCQWLTKEFAQKEELAFNKVSFTLPTEQEWEHAASGGDQYNEYPWGGPYTRNSEGEYLANFYTVPQGAILMDSTGKLVTGIRPAYEIGILQSYSSTAPVKSYYVNDLGLYCMAGNVEEMLKTEGIAKGGSWKEPGYYLKIHVNNPYQPGTADCKRGFRVAMHVQK